MGNDWRVACASFAQQGHYVDEWFSVVLGVRLSVQLLASECMATFYAVFYTTIIHGTVMGIVAKKYSAAWNCDVYGCRLDEPSLQKAVRRR